ncbi:prepilin peptidase [Allopusillimonas ginsengisoli]|uniref:prepilin peptidase n=1 Tax=Allopusillimonas ginsengisoli TaxID=453575 RepID=UPI0010206784|nr:A24 family peptidase [Allopusillimonas ginsengisoli]TEA80185.1 prepilin peptidase [Allopusillimonas ginsengisoli]
MFSGTFDTTDVFPAAMAALLGVLLGVWSARLAQAYEQALANGHPADAATLKQAFKASLRQSARAAAPSALILAAVLFWACLQHGWSLYFLALSFAAFVLCSLALIDWRTGLLPDALNYPLLAAGLLVAAWPTTHLVLYSAILGAALGFGFLWLLTWMFRLIRQVDGMGQGDFKLAAALGAWCGAYNLLIVLFLASLAGVLFSMWHQRTLRPTGAYPFGPFLAGAGLFVLLAAG